jgi:hypothetical protein
MKSELALVVLDRMAGVVATLIANDRVGRFTQHIDDLALALVTPLSAYNA